MAKSHLNDTGLNILIQQLSNKIKSHTSGSITDTNGVLDNPNNFATTLAIVDYVKNITDNGAIIVPITETIMALTTEVGKYYRLDVPVETLAVTLPAMGVVTSTKTVVIYLTGGTTPDVTITATDNKRVVFQNGYEINSGMTYEIKCMYNGAAWIVTVVEIFVPPMNIITYEASAKLAETTDSTSDGIHTNAFSGTSGQLTMTSHTFENGVGTITFNGDVTSIGQRAFYNCSGLTSITIPDSVTSIGDLAFYECSGLTSITIPDSVTSIDSYAFTYCSSLTSITIPDSVTSIGGSAFSRCTGLTSIVVDSANAIYDSRNNCNAIINTSTNELIVGCKNTVIPDTVTSIGSNAFFGCTGLTSITIPDSVTSIGGSAFNTCTGLTSIIIGSGVTRIDDFTFSGCTGLTSITIPDSVTSIGGSAFSSCTGLTSVIIGSGVTRIKDFAFSSCTGLTNITCNATTAPTIKNATFKGVKTGGTLTVPTGSTGYNVWMGTGDYYLGKYNWTKVEQ